MAGPFRFGVMTNGGTNTRGVVELAKKVEDLGYEGVYYNDHYVGPGAAMEAANHAPQELAAIPIAALAATATSTLTVGFRVICIDYHHPVVLAKEMATLDQLSNGRLDIGLGAGWIAAEYDAMNIRLDPPSVRLERLGDVVELLRQCFDDRPVNFDGKSGVRAHGFSGAPKPTQRPSPPIAIGGGGPKVLQLAGRVADIVAFNVDNRTGKLAPENIERTTAGPTLEKIGWIREAAADRFEQIELEIGAHFTFVTPDVEGTLSQLGAMTFGMFDLPPEDTLQHPHALIGDVDRICDIIEERRETFGFNRVTVLEHTIESFAPVVDRLSGK
jgi:probable F420-dependent oxidoreductase